MSIATYACAATDVNVYNRAAAGDLTVQGGARRIHGNMAEMYQAEIELAKQQHAKNVILLIGDGMGDSVKPLAARNLFRSLVAPSKA